MKRVKSQSGNAMLEFALSWAVFGVLFTAIFDYGYSFWTYNRLVDTVQNAAHAAAMMDFDISAPASYTNAIKNIAVYGDPSGGTSAVVPGLTTSQVVVSTNPIAGSTIPTYVTVQIQGYSINAIFGSHTFNKPRVTTMWLGHSHCSGC